MSQSERQMAVKTLRALQRVDSLLEGQANEWEEVDEYLRGQIQDIRDQVATLKADIEETYPGRRKASERAR
ncbi:MAG: hypothetical protein AB1832_01010 [Pseudomonadota bacterium]